jgi:uridine kinase
VQESKILFLCIIAAPEGIRRVFDRFPTLKIVTSEIESHVEDEYTVIPGELMQKV